MKHHYKNKSFLKEKKKLHLKRAAIPYHRPEPKQTNTKPPGQPPLALTAVPISTAPQAVYPQPVAAALARGSLNVKHCFLAVFLLALVCQASAVDPSALANVRNYLATNREYTRWEQNESGFVRTRLPKELLTHPVNSTTATTLDKLSKLRINFWHRGFGSDIQVFGDLTAHDHPNGFRSHILKGGYVHELYDATAFNTTKTSCSIDMEPDDCHTLTEYDKTTKTLTAKGTASLTNRRIQAVKPGDIVDLDDKAIHRIKHFFPDTMTLNEVRNDGNQKINIFVSPKIPREVTESDQRKKLSALESLVVTNKVIDNMDEYIANGCRADKDPLPFLHHASHASIGEFETAPTMPPQ